MKSKIVSIVVTIAILLSSVTTCIPVLAAENESSSGVGSFVERMYTVALGRDADESGKANWVTMLQAGSHDGAGIAREFILGDEFKMRGLSNEDYVDVLYSTFFDRVADAEGKNLWVTILEGGNSREYVLSQFVNLDEFKLLCESYGISRGVMLDTGKSVNPGVTKFTERLYELVLGRTADAAGLYNWTYFMTCEVETPKTAATQFFNSQEYLMKNTDGEIFVGDLYKVFMGREADEDGLKFWGDCLMVGMTRDNLISEFAASEEFKAIMASYGLGGDVPTSPPELPTAPESPTEPEPPTEPETPTEPEPTPHVHSYSVEIVAATCTEDGYENQICACGDEIITVIPATDHTAGNWEVGTSATDLAPGLEVKKCTSCEEVLESREIEKLPHTHSYVKDTKAVTCTEDGYEQKICACGDVIEKTVIPSTGHVEGDWVTVRVQDVGVTGLKEVHCVKCDEVLDSEESEMLMTDGVDSVYYITVRNDDGTKSEIPIVGHYNEEEAQEMLTLVNEYRVSKDLTALDMNRDGMMSYTDLRAVETSYLWDHTRPSGWGLDFSENIAYAPYDIYGNPISVETIFNAWIESYGHRKNIEAYRARNSTAISVFYRKTPVKNVDGEIIKYLYTAYWVETFY